jgi:hypothetical protein
MATPAQLVEALSFVTGVPLPTVVDIDRKLVKAGLRTKGGRGLHAARMTSLDAARLLTAVLGSAQANTAAEAVTRYAQTHVDRARSSDALYAAAALEDLSSLPGRHSFVDALAALIGSASVGSLAKLIAKSGDDAVPRIEVFAFTRATRGRIRLSGLSGGGTASIEYVQPPSIARSGQGCGTRGDTRTPTLAPESVGDLEQSRRATGRTILAIAKLLSET